MRFVSLKNVNKQYKGNNKKSVTDFNLDIEKGEFIAFVGPSGCGKSTTLRMIAGFEEVTEGKIEIDDKVVNDLLPRDRGIAMVFQNYALYPHMTVEKNIAFGLKNIKTPQEEINKKVDWAIDVLGLEEYRKRKPKNLSGGQRQRVALGRAIVRNQKVFLMDEPLSNLDAKLRVSMRNEITKLHRELGATTIYVTHDQVEAMTMGNKIVVIKDGIIQQIDTPSNLYNNPANLFVASFIGTPQMNFINAKIVKHDKYMLSFGEFNVPILNISSDILSNYVEKPVIIGIRPEDLYYDSFPADIESEKYSAFNAQVELTELTGADTYLYLSVNNDSLTAKVKSDTKVKTGDKIKIYMDALKLYVFDSKSGKNILY